MAKLAWYLNRLKAMNPIEPIWRVQQQTLYAIERQRHKGRCLLIPDADRILGELENKGIIQQFPLPDWHACFSRDASWPLVPSSRLQYKQNDLYGDARANWELNRLQILPALAWKYLKQGHEPSLHQAITYFYHWISNNPFLMGISWTSIMELAIRAYSLLITADILKRADPQDPHTPMLLSTITDLMACACRIMSYVTRHISKFSSANNHLIVEMVLLGIAGDHLGKSSWRRKANRVLEREILRQNWPDGVNKEQSLHYHLFVLEACLLHGTALLRAGSSLSDSYKERLHRMSCFAADMMAVNGYSPHIGDSDEGILLNLDVDKPEYGLYVLQFAGLLLGKSYIPEYPLHQSLIYLFDCLEAGQCVSVRDNGTTAHYPLGGHTIFKHRQDGCEAMVTFDHAPLGFGKTAAHGHADALSITLTVNGIPFIVDPGTYIYHAEKEWRDYFRRTIHHNTIALDGKDQSEMRGAFLWGRKARAWVELFEKGPDMDRIVAGHDGYRPCTHIRELRFYKPGPMVIIDTLDLKGDTAYEMTFCLDKAIKAEPDASGSRIILHNGSIRIHMCTTEHLILEKGWVSEVYGNKHETTVIKARNRGKGQVRIVTAFSVGSPVWIDNRRISTENQSLDLTEP